MPDDERPGYGGSRQARRSSRPRRGSTRGHRQHPEAAHRDQRGTRRGSGQSPGEARLVSNAAALELTTLTEVEEDTKTRRTSLVRESILFVPSCVRHVSDRCLTRVPCLTPNI